MVVANYRSVQKLHQKYEETPLIIRQCDVVVANYRSVQNYLHQKYEETPFNQDNVMWFVPSYRTIKIIPNYSKIEDTSFNHDTMHGLSYICKEMYNN